MTRRYRWFGLALSVALAGLLLPTGSVLAQSEATGEVAAETTSAALPSGYTWEELAMPKQAGQGDPGAGLRLVAVDAVPGELSLLHAWSRDFNFGSVSDQSTWASSDGATWKPAKGLLDAAFFANATAWLVAGDDRLIMSADGNLMTSPDGGKWKQFKWPKKQWYLGARDLRGILRTPAGFFAVARKDDRPLALSSVDGTKWIEEQVAPDGSVAPGALAHGADGTIVLAGSDPDRAPLLWVRSPDGEWTSVPAPWDHPTFTQFMQLGYAAGRFFLQTPIPADDQDHASWSVWTSPDGVTWEPGPTTGQQEHERSGMAVGPIEGGVLVVTPDQAGGPPLARWSDDWETWTEAPVPELPDGPIDPWLGRLHDGRIVLFTRGSGGSVSAWAGTALP